ncbi:MAG: leucine--tRNA ligase, partial [Flavobacterium sp.]|nr:leucine--tRNA ligase [Flavobacterium sp.]
MKYNPNDIEPKWQKYWAENQTFAASNNSDKPKYYVLDMFPYPSGAGLHVGHPLGYIASDIYARYKRHTGFNVLHPQGYDSFGLPAEQYAIQTGQHPEKTTRENIARYREQLDQIGFSFDWSREVRTSSPEYYKWTQWIFIQLFDSWYNKTSDKAESICTLIREFETHGNELVNAVCDEKITEFTADEWSQFSAEQQQQVLLQYRLTYLAETEVNWCPALGTVLANDEIVNGVSERGGHPVVRKKMKQWSMRISAYAERLLQGLNTIDWTQSLKDSQTNWIGKSVGATVTFRIMPENPDHEPIPVDVFTTRPDTIFGVTFMTLAPEHELVPRITTPEQKESVDAYIQSTAKRSERERMADVKSISGVFTGAFAEHPFTKEPIQVWIGDYVLAGYGTGAVMAVPCGDERDFAFAKHFDLPIKNIFANVADEDLPYGGKENVEIANSIFLNGMDYKEATQKAIEELERVKSGTGKTNYRLRDAVFSRQRYWGEPFPVYYVGGLPQVIDPKHLPIRLPEVEKYLPTEDGLPPLGNSTEWAWDTKASAVVPNELIDNVAIFPLELNTMPGWAGSSWYWLRYMDANNESEFVSKDAEQYWQNVDLYIGGSEHATGHLLYSRFWNKFLFDRGYISQEEPFKKLINQGMILGMSAIVYRISGTNQYVSKNLKNNYATEELRIDVNLVNASDEVDIEKLKVWIPEFSNAEFILENGKYIVGREVEKMSKRWYNVVNPDDICAEYGADTLRLYEMFLGPLEQAKPWNTAGITGVFGFLKKLWRLYFDDGGLIVTSNPASSESLKSLHKTIKKVREDIEGFSFNTSVSQFMICVNELTAHNCHERSVLEPLAVLISPYAPHIAEELWEKLGHEGSISEVPFPRFQPEHLIESSKEYPVSFNGKMRFTLELPLDLTKEQIQESVLNDSRTVKHL